jgi:hypothetical protein
MFLGLVVVAACNTGGDRPPVDASAAPPPGENASAPRAPESQPPSTTAATAGQGRWIRLDAKGQFTFEGPPETKHSASWGTDSLIGKIEAADCVMSYDSGGYGGMLDEEAARPGARDEKVTIDGVAGRLVSYHEPGAAAPEVTGVAVPQQITMVARCQTQEGAQTARRMFHTLEFGFKF